MKVVLKDVKGRIDGRVLLLGSGKRSVDLPKVDAEFLRRARSEGLFRGAAGEVCRLLLPKGGSAKSLVLVGIGDEKEASSEVLRRSVGVLSRQRSVAELNNCVLDISTLSRLAKKTSWKDVGRAIVEGWVMGCYSFRGGRSAAPPKRLKSLGLSAAALNATEKKSLREGLRLGDAIARGVNEARELANAPPNELYPETLARRVRAMARGTGLTVKVFGQKELEREKMGGVLAVGKGSRRPPRFIIVEHKPKGRVTKTLVLVGKAVTFDTGGISIKPARGMQDMKFDMGGGATVVGAMQAIAELNPKTRVVALIPSAENMPDGNAYRPGDIVTCASGKTVEILNTDAEGRMLLADGLHYAKRYKPDGVIDVATLTGAVVVALGSHVSGLMSNDSRFAKRVLQATDQAGERFWELPLFKEAYDAMKSKVADLRNSGGRDAGAITAGAFLANFAEGLPWAHLDIAGTGWSARPEGYHAGGATGVGVRSLVELALGFQN